MPFISGLSFLGTHARLCLPLGILVALLLPDMGSQIRLFVPYIIVMIYASAMIRLDLWEALRGSLSWRIVQNIGFSLGILVLVPCLFSSLRGARKQMNFVCADLVCCGPAYRLNNMDVPVLGFRPVLAMELVVMTSLLAPFTGPFLGNLFN